ncbi:MAG: SPASM domain-containing protein [Chitinophagaceae bacterium]|nr:SPASM domain-containing protein [Chitinophagaceae bacterium]
MPEFNYNDSVNFLSKLSFRKTWNGIKVLTSYELTRLLHKPIQWGLPLSMSFEPTTACNLHCPECPSGLRSFTRPRGMLDSKFFKKTIDSVYKDLMYLIFYFQGEPYLNKKFLEMVAYAHSKKIYTATSTNGHFLSDEMARKTVESGLDRLIISIDGTTQEVYQQYRRGGNLQTVIQGARNIVKWKKELKSKKPYVFFQFLVVRPNEHQIVDVKKLAKEVGVDDVRFKTAQVYDYENDPNHLIPKNEKYSRYVKKKDGHTEQKNKMTNHCWRLWHANVVTWDGTVVPCCFDKDAKHKLGNLNEHSMKEIWQNKDYKEFRKQITISRKNIDICANCSEGLHVWKKG